LWEKICRQKLRNNFSGKFGEIRAKILRTLKNLLAPTLMPGMIFKSDGRQDEELDTRIVKTNAVLREFHRYVVTKKSFKAPQSCQF